MASFWKSLKNWFRGKKDKAAESLADPIRDGKFAIEDSQDRIREFQMKVAKFMAVQKTLEREMRNADKEVAKWQNIAQKAAKKGNRQHVAEAVEAKQRAEAVLKEKEAQHAKNEEILKQLRRQVQNAVTKIAQAKANHAQLVARHEGAQVRKELAQAATDFGSSGPLAELDDLQKAVDTEESEAEAFEEMAATSVGPASLEEEYGAGSDTAVEDEVSRLMKEAGH